MNVHRGLFRAWIAGSAIYIGADTIAYWSARATAFGCLTRTNVGPWCNYWAASDYVRLAGEIVLPPASTLLLGLLLIWVLNGFRNR